MPAKPNALQAVLERQARGSEPMPAPESVAEPVVPDEDRARFQRPSREGKRLVAAHVDPKVARQLKLLAAEDDTTVQALLEEALDLLFVKKGRGPLIRINN